MENKKTVLAIDDNQMLLDLLEKMLNDSFNVETANSASTALSYLNTKKIDIILLDIEMPNISGFDFLYDVRKIPSYVKTPIIIVSGHREPEFLEEARNSSAFDVLIKPVRKDVLIKTIEKSLAVSG